MAQVSVNTFSKFYYNLNYILHSNKYVGINTEFPK